MSGDAYVVDLSCSHQAEVSRYTVLFAQVMECPTCRWGSRIVKGSARPSGDSRPDGAA